MTPVEVWQIYLLQMIFLLFLGGGLIIYWRFRRPVFFVLSVSLFSGLAYLVMIYKYHVTWWGLQGDEIFVAANLQKMAAGHFFSDFFYNFLPPFYPPLYFWVIGLIAFIFDFSGVTAAHVGIFLTIIAVPLLAYFCQRYYFKNFSGKGFLPWQSALIACLIMVVYDKTAIILKPYEFISAVLVVFWTIFLLNDLQTLPLSKKQRIFYSISGSILFLTFYFWFFIVGLAIGIYRLFSRAKFWNFYKELSIIGTSILIISAVYIVPLIYSYWRYGSENWQSGFLTMSDFNLYLPFVLFTPFGLLSLIGLISLVVYFKNNLVKALASLLIACYLWQITNALTMIFFQATFLPAKPFIFLAGTILMIAAGYGIGQVCEKLKLNIYLKFLFFILAFVFFSNQLLFGAFIYDPSVQNQITKIKNYSKPEIAYLENKIKSVEGLEEMVVLSGGIPELSAYLPLNYYLSYNIHFSHPAAHFSQRYNFVKSLATAKDALVFYQMIKSAPLEKIDALLLFKGEGDYPFIFWIDNFPDGAKEEVIWIKAALIDLRYFNILYEDKFFILFQVK